MLTRRAVIQAAATGICGGLGSAMAQQSPRRKAKGKSAPANSALTPTSLTVKPPALVENDERLGEVLAPVRDAHHLPGLMGAILVGHRLATIGAIGIRKIGSSEPLRVTDKIHLGSCGKAMTATVVAELVEEKKLAWGSTLREVFPEQAEVMDPQYQTVTLSHLLTHRAGLPPNVSWWELRGRNATEQRLSILTSLLTSPPRHKPGSNYEYSNVGYVLAGLMAEMVTGQPWETLVKERLFAPLDMTTAGFGAPGKRGEVDQPWGHRPRGGEMVPVQIDNAPPMVPAGGIHCSMADWGKFAALHLSGDRGQAKLLKPTTFRVLHTPPAGFDYAAGWIVCQRTWAGGRALTHSGSNTAWFATVWIAPAINMIFLAATNQGDKAAETATDEAIAALIRSREFLLGSRG